MLWRWVSEALAVALAVGILYGISSWSTPVAAGLLAAVLLVSTSKMFIPRERIAAIGHAGQWVMDFSPGALRAIAALEFLAAAGLILPAVLALRDNSLRYPIALGATVVLVGAITYSKRSAQPTMS